MRNAPIKFACLCLVFAVISINSYFIIKIKAFPYEVFFVVSEVMLCCIFILLLVAMISKNYHSMQYERLFNEHPIPMWIYEKTSLRFLSVNEAAVQKYGYNKSEFRQLTLKDIREPEEVLNFMENVTERCNGAQYRGIWKHRKKNGDNFFVEIYSHPTIYYGKEARFIMAKDIDQQVRSAKEAHELGVRYELLTQATNDAIYDKNLITNTLTWNHGLLNLFHHNEADAGTDLVQWWQNNLHPADSKRILTSLDECILSGNRYWSEEYRFLCADGCYKYVIDRAFIVYENACPLRMIGMIQDIDKHVKQAQRLEEQNQTLREIAWINSHEIRRPVVSILSIAGLFDKSNQDIHLNSRLMEWLHESTKQLDAVIHKIEYKAKDIK